MKKIVSRRPFFLILVFVFTQIIIVIPSLLMAQERVQVDEGDILFQVSTIDLLVDGAYDGLISFGEVKEFGDFGLGTFEALNGELVVMDGEYFQVTVDGVANPVEDEWVTPFAAVTYFEADETLSFDSVMGCRELEDALLNGFPSEQIMYAIRVSGEFSTLQTRSVPEQEKPYIGLAEVIENQTVFDFEDVEATMVGFWVPDYMSTLNVAGFHFHALTADKSTGGHVLDCEIQNVTVEIDYTDGLQVELSN